MTAHTHRVAVIGAGPSGFYVLQALLASGDAGLRVDLYDRLPTPYGPPTNLTPLAPGSVANTGGGQGHENMQPFLALHFCIALQGLFPSRS